MSLAVGTKIGAFEIVSSIGAGGMGEVYRARDTQLNRAVAVKILPELFAADPERLTRFEREAQTLASLNHPNIAQIYGIERSGDVRALILELVEGEDLDERLKRGPIEPVEAVSIARQIAEALEAAHERGIIHRDLKPANVKLRSDGTVKVLDFGLAKAVDPSTSLDGSTSARTDLLANSPTFTSPAMTRVGVILGTAAYMAPEQAKGRVVDKRGDIWAFGVILFEMLSGRTLFAHDSVAETLGAVLHREPEWTLLPESTSPALRRLLARALARDPKHRLRDIGDALPELAEALAPVSLEGQLPPRRAAAWRQAFLIATAAAVVLGAVAARHLRETPAPQAETRYEISGLATTADSEFGLPTFAIAPDGHAVVYLEGTTRQLWVRRRDSTTAHQLEGTQDAKLPFWSPDSRWVGFLIGGRLKRVSVVDEGSTPQWMAGAETFAGVAGMAWTQDDGILVSSSQGIIRTSAAAGGQATIVGTEAIASWRTSGAALLPDGRHYVFSRASKQEELSGIFVASLDGGEPRRLLGLVSPSIGVGAGGFIYVAENDNLYGYPFDFKALAVSGERVLIATGVRTFSASPTGSFAYRASPYNSLDLAWVDRSGTPQSRIRTEGFGNDIELSPDERHAAIVQLRDRNFDIWIVDLARAVTSRFTTGPTLDRWPSWSADSRRLAYASGKAIVAGVRGGAAAVERLMEGETEEMPSDWGPDGSLIYRAQRPDGTGDLFVKRPGPSGDPIPFAATDFEETRAQFSPDGRWVAYESNQSGRMDVYVRPFLREGEEVQVSAAGGVCVRWRPDGREIYYLDPQSKLMAADVRTSADGREITFGVPHALFVASIAGRGAPGATFKTNYDVARDGRFLMLVPNDEAQKAVLTVIHDWNTSTRSPSSK